MHIDELRSRFDFALSRHTVHEYVRDGIIPPPKGYGRWAQYGPQHVSAIAAYRALQDNNTRPRELITHLREESISVVEYLRRRERAIKAHGLGYA